jgi:DNA-binding MarR family transcriptional regulator
VAGIDDWDEPALTALHEAGKASASELAERIEIDQFDEGMARAWINDALGRRLIRRVKDSSKTRHYEITEKGSARIGRPPPALEEPGEDAGD